jgi:DNA-binding NarL/FixJ family response regulator
VGSRDRLSQPVRVLLVDDSAEFAESARALLAADARIEVVGIARDGDEAIALATELQPDLVLMDIEMPRLNGVEATRAIRDCCPSSHVVMLTGRHERADELGSGEAGAVGFLHKEQLGSPRLADELLALVELA